MEIKTEVKHTPPLDYSTPKPWRIRLTSNHDYIAIDGAADPNDGVSPLIFEERYPSEWLIRALCDSVRAVNANDELVAAATQLLENSAAFKADDKGWYQHIVISDHIVALRKALDKAIPAPSDMKRGGSE